MMAAVTVGALALGLAALFGWAFRVLPRESWQIALVWPRAKGQDGMWRGTNLTYYGVFNGLGLAVSVAVAIFLPSAVDVPLRVIVASVGAVLAVTVPASRVINRLVEGHWHGFTIGGASTVGMVMGPWLVMGITRILMPGDEVMLRTLCIMGAIAPAYALGEGIGRLACLSFGCCYGKPVDSLPPWLARWMAPVAMKFNGPLKKAAYAHALEGRPLVPVQAMTSVISSLAGLAGMLLYLNGHLVGAYVVPVSLTQAWRFTSEFLRADDRGEGRLSAYQLMALGGALYTLMLGAVWPAASGVTPDTLRGLLALWTPGSLLTIQACALLVAIRMGLSTVTRAEVRFSLEEDRVAPLRHTPPPA